MKELLRLQQIYYDSGGSHALANYNLTLFQGEILFLMGLSGSGKTHVMDLVRGAAIPRRGRIYLDESPVDPLELPGLLRKRIRFVESTNQMVQNLSVLDNLTALTHQNHVWRFYSRKAHFRAVEEALSQAGIHASPNTRVARLPFLEQQKLAVLKAYSSGASLVVLNCIFQEYGGADLSQLGAYMRQLSRKGMSFLVVSEKPIDLIQVADRFQIIHRGMDVREWPKGQHDKERLSLYATNFSARQVRDIGGQPTAPVVGITDVEWVAGVSARQMMESIRRRSPQIWQQYIHIPIPRPGVYYEAGAVWIPQHSGSNLFDNLSIPDNLVMCIPDRAGTLGVIHSDAKRFLLREFQTLLGLDASVTRIAQLDKAERKILSIYRWVLCRPHTIVLETPFWGMDIKDMERVRQYILHLSKVGIRMIVLTKTAVENGSFGDPWILSRHGRAKVMQEDELPSSE